MGANHKTKGAGWHAGWSRNVAVGALWTVDSEKRLRNFGLLFLGLTLWWNAR